MEASLGTFRRQVLRSFDRDRALRGGVVRLRAPGDQASPAPVPAGSAAGDSWAGCAVVRVGPRCELGADRKLVVWVAGDEGPRLAFAADGRPLTSRTQRRCRRAGS